MIGVIAAFSGLQQATAGDPRFVAAHRALRHDSSVQFDLQSVTPPPEAPAWLRTLGEWFEAALRPVGRLIQWISSLMPDAPYARILLWTLIVAALLAFVWVAAQRLRNGAWRIRRRPPAPAAEDADEWKPDAAPARQWLSEADALAARGDYAEAIHHLLQRGVEDIERRRPRLVRPASTSRDLAAAPALPAAARDLFGRIAALVERSLFAGRPVDADDWASAREAYADFALPKAWRG